MWRTLCVSTEGLSWHQVPSPRLPLRLDQCEKAEWTIILARHYVGWHKKRLKPERDREHVGSLSQPTLGKKILFIKSLPPRSQALEMPSVLVWMAVVKSKGFNRPSSQCDFHKTKEIFKNSTRVLPHTQLPRRLNPFSNEWLLYSSCWISCSEFGWNSTSRPKAKWGKMLAHFVGVMHKSDGKVS